MSFNSEAEKHRPRLRAYEARRRIGSNDSLDEESIKLVLTATESDLKTAKLLNYDVEGVCGRKRSSYRSIILSGLM